jgi:hypothetical protein
MASRHARAPRYGRLRPGHTSCHQWNWSAPRSGPGPAGTLIQRHVRCGKPRCRCHADPPVLHGPYWQWTRKTGGKTVTRLVADDQLDDYRQWLDNHRRLRALVAELEALTLAIADTGPRAKRRPAPPSRHTTHA